MKKLLAVSLMVFAAPAFAQMDGVEIKATKVAGSVYVLEGGGGNIGVSVGDDGIVIVDDQFAPLAPKIKAALKGLSDKPLRFVLNTHHHDDHTNGNRVFSAEVPIIAHENVRKQMQRGMWMAATQKLEPAPVSALPVLTFDQSMSVHLNGEEIRAVHLPSGHTGGDSIIWFPKSKVLHMGDTFFNGKFPFVDTHGGGSVKGLIANLEKVLKELPPDFKVIPGHGAVSDAEGVRKFLAMLKDTRAVVAKGVKSKQSLEQLKQRKVLSKWDGWASDFVTSDAWTEALYMDVNGK
jgi:glyoxylase-like metal-dependent hydrolase (beta-lactamase superfamily II)